MRWTEYFSLMQKQAMEGMMFYREYWLETLVLFLGLFALFVVFVFVYSEIVYRRKTGKWFNLKRLWK